MSERWISSTAAFGTMCDSQPPACCAPQGRVADERVHVWQKRDSDRGTAVGDGFKRAERVLESQGVQ